MMTRTTAKGGHTNRKFGRNSAACLRYKTEGRREKNKARKLRKHTKRQPLDLQAKRSLDRLLRGGVV